ncbi:MAG: AAA family ATPase [Candidatus Moranbacteria bacterium]|nr:AAA family ATPase [Candidatus Moranbacteria bacterium]
MDNNTQNLNFLPRFYNLKSLINALNKRVLVIYGPRRVGKTTLINNFLNETKLKYRLDSGENLKIQRLFNSNDLANF